MGGSIVAMDQATDYVTRWQTLYSETLGSGRLQPDQSREAVDVFIEGIKPVGFRDKITRAVRDFRMRSRDEKRAQFRTGQFESDDLDGICWFTLQLARKADFHSVKYSGITGDVSSVSVPQDEPEKDRSEKHKRHTSDSGPHSFDSDFKMSRSYGNPVGTGSFGSSAGTT
ncbi:hypothetical protein ADUPG1_002721, partial [Aduncisulcus paluster]